MHPYQILQFQWLNSSTCDGPPNAMYSMSMDSLEDTHPRTNQSWPGMFRMQMKEGPYGECGVTSLPVNDQCCSQSLDTSPEFSNGYLSGRPSLIDTTDIMTKMPLESNGHHYCNIRHLGAVTDYNFVAFLADDKVCIDNYYRCFSNHSISVYSDSDCQGSSNNYFLPDTHQSISGLGEGSFLEIQGGKSIKSWINYVPGTLAAAPSLSFQGAMQNMLFIISFVLDASLLYYMVRKSYRGVTNFVIYGSITQLLWLIHNFVYAYFWRIPLPDNKINQRAQSILVATANFLLNIGTLLSTFHTLTVMNTLNNISRKRRVMQYVFLITTHIILAGGYYVSLCFKSDNDFSFCIPYHISRLWIRLHHLWMLFVFLWNLIPSVSIPMTICRIKHKNDTRYQLIKRIYDVDKTMVLMIFIQIGCAFIYWALGISASISNVFGDSYVVYTLIVFSVCIVSFHSFLNVLLLERLIETINLIHSGNAFGNFPQSTTKSQTTTKI